MTEDKMVGWGVVDGQGSLACCGPWSHRESDTTEQLNNKELNENKLKSLAENVKV